MYCITIYILPRYVPLLFDLTTNSSCYSIYNVQPSLPSFLGSPPQAYYNIRVRTSPRSGPVTHFGDMILNMVHSNFIEEFPSASVHS